MNKNAQTIIIDQQNIQNSQYIQNQLKETQQKFQPQQNPPSKPKSPRKPARYPLTSSELIIGRMDHICCNQNNENFMRQSFLKNKKNRKNDLKFISMILEDLDSNNGEELQKRAETIKKIRLCSEIYGNENQGIQKSNIQNIQNTQNNIKINQILQQPIQLTQSQQLIKQQQKNKGTINIIKQAQRQILARSRTINFYNQFIQNNQQLSFIMTGYQKKVIQEVFDQNYKNQQ